MVWLMWQILKNTEVNGKKSGDKKSKGKNYKPKNRNNKDKKKKGDEDKEMETDSSSGSEFEILKVSENLLTHVFLINNLNFY